MIVAGKYSFNNGEESIIQKYPHLLKEIYSIIQMVNAEQHKTKKSKEKTMLDRMLNSPVSLNRAFKKEFYTRNWQTIRVSCDYPTCYYTEHYRPMPLRPGAFREMDYVKDRLGVEVQFGKYAFMVYNVCAKMTIFNRMGYIDAGLEIVPIKQFADDMSTGVSYFEQFIWDLEQRGVSNIDIPVLVLGIDGY